MRKTIQQKKQIMMIGEIKKMKIMTWNIQEAGIKNRNNPQINNIANILTVIEKEDPDVIVIQEFQYNYKTKIIDEGLKYLGYKYFQFDESLKSYTLRYGVLIASKYELEAIPKTSSISEYSKRNWNEVYISKYDIRILGVDVPLAETTCINGKRNNNRREKQLFLEALDEKFMEYKNNYKLAVILGDFNLHEEAVFKEYLQKFSDKLTEISIEGATFGKYKFDYIYANKNTAKKLKERNKPMWTKWSDHAYLTVRVDT